MVSCLFLQASTQPSSKQRPPAGFVYAQGTRFFKDGSPWYFQGTNIYWLGIASIDKYSDVTVQGIFNDLSKAGIRVIRFWGFGHGWSHMTTDSRGQWTLTQAAWARLDLCVSQASQYGIKVIFPFVNFEPDLLGMQFFAQQVLGPGVERERFYVDSRVFKVYQGYVNNIIYHWNPLTGRRYIDEPAILAWELANEPHTGDSFEMGGQYPHFQYGDTGVLIGKGQVVGRLVNQWLCRAATYIKSLDQNHMVTTGEEGYRSYGPDMPFNQWLNNGMKGVDYEANVKCPDIDFNTLHVYPDNWRIPFNNFHWDRAALSIAANKPIVLEEYGCCKQADYAGKRDVVFQAMHQAADNLGFAGTIVWQLLPWSGLEADSNYDFAPTETGGPEVLAHAATQNARSW
ncbi:glycoside hydrolase superfamily [Haematococcus lacustris]